MIAITTSNSTNVNAWALCRRDRQLPKQFCLNVIPHRLDAQTMVDRMGAMEMDKNAFRPANRSPEK